MPLAYVPAYLGSVDTEIRQGVHLIPDADHPEEISDRQTELVRGIEQVLSLHSMPTAALSPAVWDVNVNLKSSSRF